MGETEQICPRCRNQAQWDYPDPASIAVTCKTCGTYQMTRQDLKQALQEMEIEDNKTRTPG